MINWAYIRLVWRNNRGFAIFSMVFITLFQFLILYLVTTFDTAAMLSAILDQMPPMMKVFLQDSFFSMLTYDGVAAFGFNHPIVLTLLIIAAALIGSFTSIILFHHLTGDIIINLLQISFNLWLFILLIFSITMLIAVYARQGIRAGNLSAVFTFVFYLLYFIAQLWDALAFTKPFNIFSYYEPQGLMFGKGNFWLDILVLGGLVLLCSGISLRRFERKDVP